MEHYTISGMTCAACQARVEKAVSKLEGVSTCSVSLLTNSMVVEGNVRESEIIKAVSAAGYSAAPKKGKSKTSLNEEEALKDTETPKLKKRLLCSLGFWLVLMYVSMGHMMYNWPLPSFFEGNHLAVGILELLLTIVIMVINQKFFISGFKSLYHLSPNMDALVALGSLSAFIYSTAALFLMSDAVYKGDMASAMTYMHEFYFESAGTILTLITLGKMLESRSKGKTTDALKGLMKLSPKTATVIRNNEEISVLVEEVKKGDIFIVKPGESIPVDGEVLEGTSTVDESSLTGESVPSDKEISSNVYAGTINKTGYLRCEAVRVVEDTTLSKIIQMVADASASKAPIAKIADKVSGIFVPAVIILSALTIAIWLLKGETVGFALARGISVLVISCPCSLGLATPVAIMVGNGVGAKNGILFKTAISLEETGKADIVVLDKTGTITSGEPEITDIIPLNDFNEIDLLTLAYSLEVKSEHPLAKAIVKKAKEDGVELKEIESFEALAGNGVRGILDGLEISGGSLKYISTKIELNADIKDKTEELASQGKTPLFFEKDKKLIGIIAVADALKKDSPEAVKELQNMGINVVMLTGDNKTTAKAIGEKVKVNEIIAGVLPDGKESVIRKLKEKGKVIMVGDGINDAPALISCDIGIAIGAGADVAIDAADVVLMKSSLKDAVAAIRLSRATLINIHENLFWAFIYNIIGIPLASGLLGFKLNPMFAALAMSLSSFCVVSNALRLNFVKIYDGKHDHKIKRKKKEKEKMEKTLKIEGMMCRHCEMHVKKALEAVDGVVRALVSHEKGEAIVSLDKEVADEVLKKAVEEEGYKVTEIR